LTWNKFRQLVPLAQDILYYKIAQSLCVCPLSPQKWLDLTAAKFGMQTLSDTEIQRDGARSVTGMGHSSQNRTRLVSFIMRGRLYSSSVQRSMLHGSETWPIRKENDVALQWAEIRMVRWMCDVKVKGRVSRKELRETRIRCHNLGSTAKLVVMV